MIYVDSNTFGVIGGCCAACVVVIFILAGIFGNYDDSSTDTVVSVINNTTDDTIKPIDFNLLTSHSYTLIQIQVSIRVI